MGDVHVRCFTALDIHAQAAAPGARTCRSPPLCVKIRITPLPSVGALILSLPSPDGPEVQLGVSHATIKPASQRVESASVSLVWAEPGSVIPALVEAQHVQFLGGRGSAPTTLAILVNRGALSAVVPLEAVLGHGVEPGDDVAFRVVFTTGGFARHVGQWSNALRVLNGPPDYTKIQQESAVTSSYLYGASWAGNVLQWLRFDRLGLGGVEHLGTQSTHPIVQGAVALDSTRGRFYSIVAVPGDSENPQLQLLTVDVASGEEEARVDLNVDALKIWNVEFDEARGLLVGVAVSGARYAVVAFRVEGGDTVP